METVEVTDFLTHLAVSEHVAASTQNQALNAIVFLYRAVLRQELQGINAVRARPSRILPTVLTQSEVQLVLEQLHGVHKLIAQLLYGSGLRISEELRLRVKDLDFSQHQIVVRDAKGDKNRVAMLPSRLVSPLQEHLQSVRHKHCTDLDLGYGSVYLPFALERKYPKANRQWIWQYIFPADRLSKNPRSGVIRRHHMHETSIQRAVRNAAKQTTIEKRMSATHFVTVLQPIYSRSHTQWGGGESGSPPRRGI